ncbi:MAG: DNA-directed RNA polymerase subunit K [Thermoplasmata archaeon]|nr:DNA-directed RNA polymerase subunit K [Thermoplasmata archaeon]
MSGSDTLTRFEKARVIGARALQISMGAPSALRTHENLLNPIDIALSEFEKGIIPIKVKGKTHTGLRNPIEHTEKER